MTDIQEKTNKTEKTILLLGASNSGKSTLGNVLINRKSNFEVFKEGNFIARETREVQCERIEIDGIKYNIIDAPGFLDTTFEIIKIHPALEKLGELDEGIDYVLFTIDNDKFNNENVDFLKEIFFFFENDVVNYITIVFTKFNDFKEGTSCTKNLEKLKDQNESIANIINNVMTIHVNNTSLYKKKGVEYGIAKRNREDSRGIILDHLTSKENQNEKKCKFRPDLHKKIKEKNEAILIDKEKDHKRTGNQVEGIRKFIEWRKNMEKEINYHIEYLITGIKFCRVSATFGAIIFALKGTINALPDSKDDKKADKEHIILKVIAGTTATKISTTIAEAIIKEVYCEKISNKIKEDIEKRSDLLTEELSKQIKYDNYANELKEELRLTVLRQFINEIKATVDKLRTIVEDKFRMIVEKQLTSYLMNDTGPEININVTNQNESKKMKDVVMSLIEDAKKSHNDKLQEDDKLLKEEQNRLRESHEKLDNEIKEIKRKLEKDYFNALKASRIGAQQSKL